MIQGSDGTSDHVEDPTGPLPPSPASPGVHDTLILGLPLDGPRPSPRLPRVEAPLFTPGAPVPDDAAVDHDPGRLGLDLDLPVRDAAGPVVPGRSTNTTIVALVGVAVVLSAVLAVLTLLGASPTEVLGKLVDPSPRPSTSPLPMSAAPTARVTGSGQGLAPLPVSPAPATRTTSPSATSGTASGTASASAAASDAPPPTPSPIGPTVAPAPPSPTAPQAPLTPQLAVIGQAPGSVVVSVGNVVANGAGIASVTVYGGPVALSLPVGAASGYQGTIAGLAAGQSYVFVARVCSAAGPCADSAPVTHVPTQQQTPTAGTISLVPGGGLLYIVATDAVTTGLPMTCSGTLYELDTGRAYGPSAQSVTGFTSPPYRLTSGYSYRIDRRCTAGGATYVAWSNIAVMP